MDDRFYLAVYDEERMRKCSNLPFLKEEDFVCDIVLPSYEFCSLGEIRAIRRSRFSEVAAKLYLLNEEILPALDGMMEPELVRHQAMAADDVRVYNVYVYVSEQEGSTAD